MRALTEGTKIAAAIILAAVIIALALFLRPTPDRYRFDVNRNEVQRFDTTKGENTVCTKARCVEMDMTEPRP